MSKSAAKKRAVHLPLTLFVGVVALFLTMHTALAAKAIDNTSHLPIPRFASLRANEVNMRTGPGMRYPIEWVYRRKGLPVEVTAEYDVWRRVRDPEGTEGWMNKAELTGRRGAFVTGSGCALRDSRDDRSESLARLEPGTVGQILSCAGDWCKVKFDGIKGYLRKTEFWGAYPHEKFN